MDTPTRELTAAVKDKQIDTVLQSSKSLNDAQDDQLEPQTGLETSGAPSMERKPAKKKSKSSGKSHECRRHKSSRSRVLKPAGLDHADGGDAASPGGEGAREEALRAAKPFGKLPFELICEIFGYLDLGDLIQLGRTSPTLHAMLLAPSAQSIWSRSRRNAGYVLFPAMSEIRFAVTMEGSLCQYCGAKGDLEMRWMARLCTGCKQQRVGPLDENRSFHAQTFSCVDRQWSEDSLWGWNDHKKYDYFYEELETVERALHEAQTADDPEKATRLATGLPETAEHPSHVQRYVADRKRVLTDREEARRVNDPARHALKRTQELELLERRKLGIGAREGRTLEILRALQDCHGWALQELAELEVHLFREPKDYGFARGTPDVPLALPDDAPLAWEDFKTDLLPQSEKIWYCRDAHRKKTARLRAACIRNSYEACGPALALALCMPVDALPTWARLEESPEVEALCRMPLTFLQAKPSAEYQQIFERAVEADRLIAIRYALAAHLDVSVEELSCDPDDYPATTYDEFFLDRVINRFEVGESEYLTYYEALATGHSAMALTKMTRAYRRRAIAHVLRAAAVKDTECSLDKVDALGAGFLWKNAPPRYKGRAYTWRRMVDLLLRGGPKGLHLADLQNVQLVYERPRSIAERDKNAPRAGNG